DPPQRPGSGKWEVEAPRARLRDRLHQTGDRLVGGRAQNAVGPPPEFRAEGRETLRLRKPARSPGRTSVTAMTYASGRPAVVSSSIWRTIRWSSSRWKGFSSTTGRSLSRKGS